MHPVLSDHELQVLYRRQQELALGVERQRTTSALLANVPSPAGTQAQRRSVIHALSAHAAGWLGRRRSQIGHPHPTRSIV